MIGTTVSHYRILEELGGGGIRAGARHGVPLPTDTAFELAIQIAEALDAAHRIAGGASGEEVLRRCRAALSM